MNPRKMQQMMEQMGIDMEELEASEVVIETDEGELVFDAPEVTKMDARGNETYTIVGSPELHESEGGSGTPEVESETEDEGAEEEIPESDIEIVAQRAGVGKSEAREALEAANGDLAAAIDRLE